MDLKDWQIVRSTPLFGAMPQEVALSLIGNQAVRSYEKGAVLELFRKLPQSRRFVPEDPDQLAVYAIMPVAIAPVDYASGFGTTYLVEF